MPLTEATKRKARQKLIAVEPANAIVLDRQIVQVIISQYGNADAASKPLAQLVMRVMNQSRQARAYRVPKKPSARVLRDISAMRARLINIVQEGEADRWLVASNPMLGGASPREAILQGQTSRVSEILVRLEEGIYV